MTELQQSKYQDLQAGLPSELSMQLAEVALALGSAEDQVTALCEECESCGGSLAELGVAVQEFGEQNPLLSKQLGDAVVKLTERQRQTYQIAFLLFVQAEKLVEEYHSMKAFILAWIEKAEDLVSGNIIWSSATQLQEQILPGPFHTKCIIFNKR
uniref:Uncharacterized protein n=1 Tax=Xiphophorus couchianus TaxID=32473 RepID=A0A3B5L5H1_9TELE